MTPQAAMPALAELTSHPVTDVEPRAPSLPPAVPAHAPGGHLPLSRHARLRRVTPQARAWQACIGAGRQVSLADLDSARQSNPAHALRARLRLVDGSAWEASQGWPSVLVQAGGAHGLPVRLAPHPQWEELAEPLFAGLPPALRQAIGAHVTSGLRRCLGRCLHVLGLAAPDVAVPLAPPRDGGAEDGRTAGGSAPALALEITVQAERAANSWLALVAVDSLPLPGSVAPVQSAERAGVRHDLRIDVRAVFGRQQLTLQQVRELALGDVVLLADVPPLDGTARDAWLYAGDTLLGAWRQDPVADSAIAGHVPATAQAGRWRRASPPPPPDRSTPLSDEPSAGAALHNLSLVAEAVIDATPQRVSDIQQWSAGSVIPLTGAVDSDQLRLRVGGHAVARGRLTAIGDTLGFEIVELYA